MRALKTICIVLAVFVLLLWIGKDGNSEKKKTADELMIHNVTEPTEEIQPVVESHEKNAESIEKQIIYEENNVTMYVTGIEKVSNGYEVGIYIENNSTLNLGFNARAYAVNEIMTRNNIYSMNCDVAAGKKANAVIEIENIFLNEFDINEIKCIDILFWAYDNDKMYREFATNQIRILTNVYSEDLPKISGERIYEQNGISIDYLSNDKNKYTFCITNGTENYLDFDVKNISINDFTSSEWFLDLSNVIVLNSCQCIFEIEPSSEFLESNDIVDITKIDFTLNVRPLEDYFKDWNTDMISLEIK